MNKVAIISGDSDLLNLCKIALNEAAFDSKIINLSQTKNIEEKVLEISPELILASSDVGLNNLSQCIAGVRKRKKHCYAIILPGPQEKISMNLLKEKNISGYIPHPITKEKVKNAALKVFAYARQSEPLEDIKPDTALLKKDLNGFIGFLAIKFKFERQKLDTYLKTKNGDYIKLSQLLGVSQTDMVKMAAEFLGLEFIEVINPDEILKGLIPHKFSRSNDIVAAKTVSGNSVILSNPFDEDTKEVLKNLNISQYKHILAEPKTISSVLHLSEETGKGADIETLKNEEFLDISEKTLKRSIEDTPIIYITNKVIENAIHLKASDMHLEPKETYYSLRFRIDGDLKEFNRLKKETGNMLITRIKALAEMDITERRRPQDGSFSIKYKNKKYSLRLATTSTAYGESVVARIIDNEAKPKPLSELGMTDEQSDIMQGLSNCTQGIILIAAPTGSGKTTTIYSFISNFDLDKKSLISVEDPIEYKIPQANQQQINDKAGVTFSGLLKSSVRQDPDILFLGEVRDEESARIAFDFSSTGHITISTVHTANATTAIFRLERFSITRRQMAETILALISQRLIKKLCPHCKKETVSTQQQKEIADKFSFTMPEKIYEAQGCDKCEKSGYMGRQAVYEIMRFDPETADLVAANKTVREVRAHLMNKGVLLMPNSALIKVASGIFDFNQVYEKILAEELKDMPDSRSRSKIDSKYTEHDFEKENPDKEKPSNTGKKKLLVADDDSDLLELISKILLSNDYDVDTSSDGLDAIIKISQNNYDLVISDLDMPNLDGLKLVKTVNEKKLGTKIILLTATSDESAEQKALEFGAADYIKKPFKKDVLLLRIKKILG